MRFAEAKTKARLLSMCSNMPTVVSHSGKSGNPASPQTVFSGGAGVLTHAGKDFPPI
nr:MAG TPA: hypothetical protein [Caudoviricetes sp.]